MDLCHASKRHYATDFLNKRFCFSAKSGMTSIRHVTQKFKLSKHFLRNAGCVNKIGAVVGSDAFRAHRKQTIIAI